MKNSVKNLLGEQAVEDLILSMLNKEAPQGHLANEIIWVVPGEPSAEAICCTCGNNHPISCMPDKVDWDKNYLTYSQRMEKHFSEKKKLPGELTFLEADAAGLLGHF